jgi:predicted nicotinamide N-methyase
VQPVPTVQEILLHGTDPRGGLKRLAEADADLPLPYWAFTWGGGLALARHVLDHPETVAGRRVVDLGCGSGIVGIAAAKAGARDVLCADIDKYAIVATQLNAARNDVSVSTLCADLTTGAPPAVDLVLVGDLFYEPDLADRVTTFLDRGLAARIDVLVGDPYRSPLPQSRLRLLAEYPAAKSARMSKPNPTRCSRSRLSNDAAGNAHPSRKCGERTMRREKFHNGA